MNAIQNKINKIWQGWTVDREIGEGSFGKVYEISKSEFGYKYRSALKVINIPKTEAELKSALFDVPEEEVKEYFASIVKDIVAEVGLMSKLKGYSNIVSYEDHAVIENRNSIGWTIYIKMELLTPLIEYIKTQDIVVSDVIKMGIDICKALEKCHQYSIIHRDIKPENIFVKDDGTYKLGDFGIARKLEMTSYGLSKKGTYSYMAPEIYRGEAYNSLVDIYSLGIVLYRFLNNNRIPFLPEYPNVIRYKDRETAYIRRISGEVIPPPANCDEYLSSVILKACEFNPQKRYQSAKEMREALEKVLEYLTIPQQNASKTIDNQTDSESMQDEISEKSIEDEPNETVLLDETEESDETVLLEDSDEESDDDSDEEDDDNKKKILIGLIALILLFVVSFVGYSSTHVKVPDLHGMTVEEATKKLKKSELKSKVQYKTVNHETDEFVIDQDIKADKNTRKGNVITVTIEKEADYIILSNYENKSLEETKGLLNASGIKVKTTEAYNNSIKKGRIIEQNLEKGTKVYEGDTASFTVSKGHEKTKVPSVIGKSQSSAKKTLKNAKLSVSTDYEYSDSVSAGDVIRQSIAADKTVNTKATVTIVVSRGEKPVEKTTVQRSNTQRRTSTTKRTTTKKKKKKSSGSNLSDWKVVN